MAWVGWRRCAVGSVRCRSWGRVGSGRGSLGRSGSRCAGPAPATGPEAAAAVGSPPTASRPVGSGSWYCSPLGTTSCHFGAFYTLDTTRQCRKRISGWRCGGERASVGRWIGGSGGPWIGGSRRGSGRAIGAGRTAASVVLSSRPPGYQPHCYGCGRCPARRPRRTRLAPVPARIPPPLVRRGVRTVGGAGPRSADPHRAVGLIAAALGGGSRGKLGRAEAATGRSAGRRPGPSCQPLGSGIRMRSPTWRRLGSVISGLAFFRAATVIPNVAAIFVKLSPERTR